VPAQNPITEGKRLLGKVLFWDEQLSSRSTISCGACHQPLAGGSDPRTGIHPGLDEVVPTIDDIFGSPGVVRFDLAGQPVEDPLFGLETQVTRRSANTAIGAAYSPTLFWDGRATPVFVDPETGVTVIPGGGALESQAVGPILSDVEMAHEGRTWNDVRRKLESSLPLSDSTDLPNDVAAALADNPSYPELFTAAFGDPTINAERIALALATYERTLVPNQTPWDSFVAGNPAALTPGQVQGWNFFNGSPCRVCHTPPTFTNHTFRNIGIRPPAEDLGRQEVTGLNLDRGRFKVPTLRNIGLKPTHMHNGRQDTVTDSVLWYRPYNPAR
jgi:cytochrome c peroxidase